MSKEPKAIKVCQSYKTGLVWFKCSECHDVFSHMIHFEKTKFYYCIPRKCPNCGTWFTNGMHDLW